PGRCCATEGIAGAGGGAAAAAGLAGALGGLRLDLADGLFERQALAGDLGLAERRIDAAQLLDQRGAGPLIERTAGPARSSGVQAGNSACDQRVVISHSLINAGFRVISR